MKSEAVNPKREHQFSWQCQCASCKADQDWLLEQQLGRYAEQDSRNRSLFGNVGR